MNLFFLDGDPRTSASYYYNRHCIKIILELAQLLYTAQHCLSSSDTWVNLHDQELSLPVYRPTHKNHPTALWVRETIENYMYTCQMGLALCVEYTTRYHKTHKCQVRLEWLLAHPPTFIIPSPIQYLDHTIRASNGIPSGCTPIPLAMPSEYHTSNAIVSYRLYYLFGKAHLADRPDSVRTLRFIWGI
jgi:hypothetical protein